MIHLRPSCVCMRLPNCRPVRLKLWFLFIAVVITVLAVNLLVSILPRLVESKDKVDTLSVNWLWQQGFNPITKQTKGPTTENKGKEHSKELSKGKEHSKELRKGNSDTQTGPCLWFPGRMLPHKIWDTTLRHTDRIQEQLNYLPKRRRLFSSAHILVWEKGGGEQIPPGDILFKSSRCLVDNCNITLDPATDLHVDVLVTSVSISDDLLLKRKRDDVYVFYQLESPMSYASSGVMSGFNWTATYRHDSTIVAPYEKWVQFRKNTSAKGSEESEDDPTVVPPTGRNYAAGKSKMAAALISNCAGGRLQVIQELRKYIRVDVYGGCGLGCEGDCLSMIHRDYKFYLAFENANCVDYITEKFFKNALR